MVARRIDGVIEAVRYDEKGRISKVRGYLRHGRVFTDLVLIDRAELLKRLKARQRIWTGCRKEYLASTFDVNNLVQFSGKRDHELLYSGQPTTDQDTLPGVPLF